MAWLVASAASFQRSAPDATEAIGLLLLGLWVCVNAEWCSDDAITQNNHQAASGSEESVGAGHGLELGVGSARTSTSPR